VYGGKIALVIPPRRLVIGSRIPPSDEVVGAGVTED